MAAGAPQGQLLAAALGAMARCELDRGAAPGPAGEPLAPAAGEPVEVSATLDRLLELAAGRAASDLHLSAGAVPVLRVGGDLEAGSGMAPLSADDMDAIARLLAGIGHEPLDLARGEIDCSFSLGPHRLRVNLYLSQGRLSAALRRIPSEVPAMAELGLPHALSAWPQVRQGLLLCCGPTGSGKSTTLAAVVREINETRPCHIVTLEDPVEHIHVPRRALVHQRSIGTDSPSFASALRAALREDPDVLLVGEMRDPETIRLAVTAAETGHLVLATVHASDSVGVLHRLIDVFPGDEQPQVRTQLAATLVAACCQTLVKDPVVPGRRHLVAEVMVATPPVRASIREGRSVAVAQAVETGGPDGMQTFDRALARAAAEGRMSRPEAEAMSRDRGAFRRALREAAEPCA